MTEQKLSLEMIEAFLADLSGKGKKAETVSSYRRCLLRLYDFLPEEKILYEDTLKNWREHLDTQKLSRASVELHCAAANSFLGWCGRWELRVPMRGHVRRNQPELSRSEYIRLLSAAQRMDKERSYMLIKTFATLGISVKELPYLTVEAIEVGRVLLPPKNAVLIPGCFRRELEEYAQRQGIFSGMIFRTATGKALDRVNVWDSINALAGEAHVDEEKCNPRCLNRLCQKTKGDIRKNVEILELQMYDNLLETEQKVIGWETV